MRPWYSEHDVKALRETAPVSTPVEVADAAARRALIRVRRDYGWVIWVPLGLDVVVFAVYFGMVLLHGWDAWSYAIAIIAVIAFFIIPQRFIVIWLGRRRGTLFAEELRSPSPLCTTCGYDLTGLDSARCPECGDPTITTITTATTPTTRDLGEAV